MSEEMVNATHEERLEGLIEQISILAEVISALIEEVAALKGQTPLRPETKSALTKASEVWGSVGVVKDDWGDKQ